MELTKANIKAVAADIDKALVEIAKKHGLNGLRVNGGSIRSNDFTLKVEGTALSPAQNPNLPTHFQMLGLPANSCGKEITYGGKKYRIIGCNLKKAKYAIQAERLSDGKVFGLATDGVKQALGIVGATFGTLTRIPPPFGDDDRNDPNNLR